MADYSIWVIEFARASSPLGLLLHGQTGDREIPYCVTVLRSAEHTILVDGGYRHAGRGRELADEDGITIWRDPADLLARVARRPGGRRRDPGHPRPLRPSRQRRGLP